MSTAGGGLVHPVAIAAVIALVLNDHWWKAAYGSWWTGKLSDFAGLIFFPLLLQGLVELAQVAARRGFRPSFGVLLWCAALTAAVFAAINVSPAAAELYRHALGLLQWPFRALAAALTGLPLPSVAPVQHTIDPTDLVALPAVGLSLWIGKARTRRPRA